MLSITRKESLISTEAGATLVEYALAVSLLVLVLIVGMPDTEQAVQNRIEEGRDLWVEWNISLETSGNEFVD